MSVFRNEDLTIWDFVPNQPDEALGGSVLLGGQLVLNEVLDSLGSIRGSKLALAELL
jgi:hypothetical protein